MASLRKISVKSMQRNRTLQRNAIFDAKRNAYHGELPPQIKTMNLQKTINLLKKPADIDCPRILSEIIEFLASEGEARTHEELSVTTKNERRRFSEQFLDGGNNLYHLVGILTSVLATEETRLLAANCINDLAASVPDDKRLSLKIARASSIYLLCQAEGRHSGSFRDVCVITLGNMARGFSIDVLLKQNVDRWLVENLKVGCESELYLLRSLLLCSKRNSIISTLLTSPVVRYLELVLTNGCDLHCKYLSCYCLFVLMLEDSCELFRNTSIGRTLMTQLSKELSDCSHPKSFSSLKLTLFLIRCLGALACLDEYWAKRDSVVFSGAEFVDLMSTLLRHPSTAVRKESLWMFNNLLSVPTVEVTLPCDWRSIVRSDVDNIQSSTLCNDTRALADKFL